MPLGPLRRRTTSLFVMHACSYFIFDLDNSVIQHNASFSEGPPAIGVTTMMVSLKMLNCTPTPSKLPSSGSFAFLGLLPRSR